MIQFDPVYNLRVLIGRTRKRFIGDQRRVLVFLTGHLVVGKSTPLCLIALVEPVSRGRVIVDGQILGRVPRRQITF